ncbi:MFS transporter [Clostridium estertheticum]|uniref:MFS transporter n=1 Tax=Clostridium estertheticum TaxID=238834 RepID=UPI0013E93EFE|nr:MFS transporter [Clostridium estertheticum]MBZ9686343.1 MFS transporter [Clostridium estertheticum]
METVVANKKNGIKELLPHKSYVTLVFANIISRFGDSLDSIAFGWMVYILTGSKLLLGTLLAVNAIPNILFSAFAGVLVDRLKKKTVLIVGYTGRGIMVSIIAFLFMTKLLRPWHLFVLTFINSTFESFTSPAQSAILPLLLPKELFLAASAISTSAYKFAELIGLGAAGIIIAIFGISGAFFIDGATFFIAAILILFIKVKSDISSASKLTLNSYFDEFKEGFSFIKNNKLLRTTIILFALINLFLSPVGVMLPAFVKENLKSGTEMLSTLGISLTIGMILGGFLVAQFGSRFKISTLIILGFFSLGINYALLCIPGNVITNTTISCILASVLFGLIGLSVPVISSPVSTYFLNVTPREILGRVSAVVGMVSMCALPLGSAASGAVSEYVSISVLFGAMGIIIILISLSLVFNKKFRQATE